MPVSGSEAHPAHPTARVFARFAGVLCCALIVTAISAAQAFANSPNPSSITVLGESVNGSSVTVTVAGTWTWDTPKGPQKDCNDSRIGVGYAVSWGDNTTNALKREGGGLLYVGGAEDDWVHSVTEGTQSVWGPINKHGGAFEETTVLESMLGETPEGAQHGFGAQGIPAGTSTAIPTEEAARRWVSNCGPTQPAEAYGVKIGNTNPAEPTNGYPSGTWGPISHTYAAAGSYTICPVMYDPHGNRVGEAANNAKEVTAGASAGANNYNNDNSVETNGNVNPCLVSITVTPKPAFKIVKEQKLASQMSYTTAKLTARVGETVDYKISVTNVGTMSETFTGFIDPNCTNLFGGPLGPLAPGESASWTCERTLKAAGEYENVAAVEGNKELKKSNPVVIVVPTTGLLSEKCSVPSSLTLLHAASGAKRHRFRVHVSAAGIKEITFYLDGRKLKTLTAAQARHGRFAVTIHTRRLHYGAHTLTVKTVMTNSACAPVAGASVFVRPRPPKKVLKFTG